MGPKTGASEVALISLGFAILLGVAAVILFVTLRYDTDPASATPLDSHATHEHVHTSTLLAPDGTRILLDSAGNEVDGLRSAPSIEVTADLPYRRAPKVFEGVGRLTGAISTENGLAFPDSWRLIIEPSKFVQGREHAGPRQVIPFDGNQRTFEVFDLALGAYRVYAEGEGVSSPAYEVLLFAIEGQAPSQVQMHKHLLMRFNSQQGCAGLVVDEQGAPVADLPVFLVAGLGLATADPRAPTTTVLETVTHANGRWEFPDCRPGTYSLLLGSTQRPLIPAASVTLEPGMRSSDRPELNSEVPLTQTLYVRILDKLGRGLPGARLRGIGPSPLDVEADSQGLATARFLLPGPYRLAATYAALGLDGEDRVEVKVSADGQSQTFNLICRP